MSGQSTLPTYPLILFDGVCNLCNGAVLWVIARDRRGLFRFASLQSRAGREAIMRARGEQAEEPLPDSIVLIDEAGLHTRSEAALRIAHRLGLPYSLAKISRVLPRFLRDHLYDWVARNRYRWFGQKESCMVPTPELKARFLDADEPPPETAGQKLAGQELNEPGHAPAPKTSSRGWGSFAERALLSYLVFYSLITTLGWLNPGGPLGWYTQAEQKLLTWVVKAAFGMAITNYPGGSGDTAYNYVQLVAYSLGALAAAAIWTWRTKGAPVSPRCRYIAQTVVRYCLAFTILQYGWDKVVPVQMPAPGPDRLLMPLGEMSPFALLWNFMGASTAYQVFAGLGEVVGGLLLIWRRTALLGALITAGVLANVVALNLSYDVPVKLYSSHLLVLALFLITPHLPRLAALLFFHLPIQPPEPAAFTLRGRWPRVLARLGLVAFLGWVMVYTPLQMWNRLQERGGLHPEGPRVGIFRVELFERDGVEGRANEDAVRWVRVGINSRGGATVVRADGTVARVRLKFDETAKTVAFSAEIQKEPTQLTLSEPEPGVIVLEGEVEGASLKLKLRREPKTPSPLLDRGFQWVNEFPFYR